MTNINCTSKCIYQKEGKCQLDNVTTVSSTLTQSCIYYSEEQKTRPEVIKE